MSFNDLLKQYQVSPDELKPAQPPVKGPEPGKVNSAPVKPTQPAKPVRPLEPLKPASTPAQPVRPAEPATPIPAPDKPVHPTRPASNAQQLLDELDHDVCGGAQKGEPVQPLRPGKDKQPAAQPPRTEAHPTRRDLPPYWYIDAVLLGITILAALGILTNWNSVMDAAAKLIMTLADMAIVAIIVLGIALFVILALRRRYRWRRWWRL